MDKIVYYNKLRDTLKRKKISVKELAGLIGFTVNGLHMTLRNNTLKIRDLVKISEVLKEPISSLIDETKGDKTYTTEEFDALMLNDNVEQYEQLSKKDLQLQLLKKENEHLKEIIKGKDELIKELKRGK